MNNKSICHVLHIINGETEDTVDVIEITRFDLDLFCEQFDVPVEQDPQMLDCYAVGPEDVAFLAGYLDSQLTFDFASYGYLLEAVTRS